MSIPLLCIALLALLCLLLGFNVSLARGKAIVACGGEPDPTSPLYKAQRAHGNTIEYAPILAILFYVLGQSQPADWVNWTMILVTACRYLLVLGLLLPATMAKPNPMRFVGALGTYIGGLVLSVVLLLNALNI
ncbi:MAPEG family protein [Endozoicomonas arenosclerae]|uniref:MAPEG family protein n=1 Tax=Endozoicomonas arenosclerae TaxID=1633495 RepID=UPI0007849AD0|nr:MAPEG family protein [Endozoicomonas arenosclerae]